MKTSELSGKDLDLWVAHAEGLPLGAKIRGLPKKYSSNWAIGGPIIEREGISLDWNGECFAGGTSWGETALIAAMRAYVVRVYGDTVPEDE